MNTPVQSQTPTAAEAVKSVLPGFNVLLMGPAGTGKTHSIGTLVDQGLEVFYLALEPGLEALLGYYTDRGLPIPDNLHWHMLKAPQASFMELLDNAQKINTLSLDSLAKMADPRTRAFGLVWGQRTKGFTAEMDMGPLRVGMDVVRRPNETEAVGRVLWRF